MRGSRDRPPTLKVVWDKSHYLKAARKNNTIKINLLWNWKIHLSCWVLRKICLRNLKTLQ